MNNCQRDILLCVTGLSPQVVTETLYAMLQGELDGERRIPSAIHVVTTLEGRRRLELSLLANNDQGGRGHFHQFCRDFEIDPASIAFDSTHIHVITDDQGQALDDIQSAADNEAAANAITEKVYALTRNSDYALHVSLAGGRKTMGFYAGYALSLFGRPQDTLSHVLVNRPFEQFPDFFYPPPRPVTLQNGDGKLIESTSQARITLARIPVVLLNAGVDDDLRSGRVAYTNVVRRTQDALQRQQLRIDLPAQQLIAGGVELKLSQRSAFWLYAMADRRQRGMGAFTTSEESLDDLLQQAIAFLPEHNQEIGLPLLDRLKEAVRDFNKRGDPGYFRQQRSLVNKALREQLGRSASKLYQIHSVRAQGQRGVFFELSLQPEQVQIQPHPVS